MSNGYRNGAFALGVVVGTGLVLNLVLWSAYLTNKARERVANAPENDQHNQYVVGFWDWFISSFIIPADTIAQWLMAALSLAAVYLLWEALKASRQTLSATQGMVRDTREIGEAQVRAYLGVTKCVVSGTDIGDVLVTIKNFGQSPAESVMCTANFGIEILDGNGFKNVRSVKYMFSLYHENYPAVHIESGGIAEVPLSLWTSNKTLAVDKLRMAAIRKAIHTGSNALTVAVVVEWKNVFEKHNAVFAQFKESGFGSPHVPENGECFTRPRNLMSAGTSSIEFGERPNIFLCDNVEP